MFIRSLKVDQWLCKIFNYSPVGIKYAVGIGSLLWGIMLLLPNQAYVVPLFAAMQDLMTENLWGLLFLIHGVISLYCTITYKKDLFAFICDATYGMLLWTTVTVALVLSSISILAHLSAQIILSICTLWLFIRFNLKDKE